MRREELLTLMRTKPGWTEGDLCTETSLTSAELSPILESMCKAGLVSRSPKDNWRAVGAAKAISSSSSDSWGKRTRMLIYAPELLADCPEFARNTFLYFVEDDLHHFRLRDYRDGKRIEVKEVKGITLSRELAAAYSRFELEFDDEESETPLTNNEFWEKRIEAHNSNHRALLERSAAIVNARG